MSEDARDNAKPIADTVGAGPNWEEQRALVRQMDEGHKRADRIRREALRDMPYNW